MKTNFLPNLQRSWFAAGALVVSAGVKVASGISQKNKAKKLQAQNELDAKALGESNEQTQRIAEDMAQQGLPSQQYAMARQNIMRNQNTAINTAQTRRGGLGSVAAIQRATNDASLGLDVANANAQNQNKRTLIGVRNQINAGKKVDVDNDKTYSYGLLGAGNQNIYNGIDQGVAGVGQGLYGALGQPKDTSSAGNEYDNISGRAPRASKVNFNLTPYNYR